MSSFPRYSFDLEFPDPKLSSSIELDDDTLMLYGYAEPDPSPLDFWASPLFGPEDLRIDQKGSQEAFDFPFFEPLTTSFSSSTSTTTADYLIDDEDENGCSLFPCSYQPHPFLDLSPDSDSSSSSSSSSSCSLPIPASSSPLPLSIKAEPCESRPVTAVVKQEPKLNRSPCSPVSTQQSIKKQRGKTPSSPPTPSPQPTTPSSKVASRILALQLLFSSKLPAEQPSFLTDPQWAELKELEAQYRLLTVVEFQEGRISVRLPSSYDILIHSIANYGLRTYTDSRATRFRWWSDSSIAQLKLSNRSVTKAIIERTIQLPDSIVHHRYLQKLFRSPNHELLLKEFAGFFSSLLKKYLHPDDHSTFEGGFGRTRKRPRNNSNSQWAFDLTVKDLISHWDKL